MALTWMSGSDWLFPGRGISWYHMVCVCVSMFYQKNAVGYETFFLRVVHMFFMMLVVNFSELDDWL